jgi:hypothetical protein
LLVGLGLLGWEGIAALGTACALDAECGNAVVEKVSEAVTANPGSDQMVTVLGKFPFNKELAESIGANWLDIDMDVWKSMDEAEQWEQNKQWLQEAIIRGDTFRLASDISEATDGSGFFKELDYLFNVIKYTTFGDGTYLIPPQQ